MTDAVQIYLQKKPWNRDLVIQLAKTGGMYQGNPINPEIMQNNEWVKYEIGNYYGESFSMNESDAQAMFNQLWELGYRAVDGSGNTGHIAAVQYHLEDMRKLVFKGETNVTIK